MKKLSQTYKELGIDFTFPIEIKDSNGEETYFETSDGFWHRKEYDVNGNETYYEASNGVWYHKEYDKNDNETFYESSNGFWYRKEYDDNGKETYFENSYGEIRGTKRQSCNGKIVTVDGKKYKLTEV